jgi:hypothetical protein
MRHRQAVRQGTLTPPSQVRLLLAQLEKKPHECWKIQCSCGFLFSVKKGLLILGVLKFQKQYKSSIEQQKSRPAFVPGGNGEEKSQKR